jgi:hypothetical protein
VDYWNIFISVNLFIYGVVLMYDLKKGSISKLERNLEITLLIPFFLNNFTKIKLNIIDKEKYLKKGETVVFMIAIAALVMPFKYFFPNNLIKILWALYLVIMILRALGLHRFYKLV